MRVAPLRGPAWEGSVVSIAQPVPQRGTFMGTTLPYSHLCIRTSTAGLRPRRPDRPITRDEGDSWSRRCQGRLTSAFPVLAPRLVSPSLRLSHAVRPSRRPNALCALFQTPTHPGQRLLQGEWPAMISLPGMPIGKHALPVCLAMLMLLLTVAFTTACGGGGSLTGGGDPLSIIAPKAVEIEIYSVDTYLGQDLPDELRERLHRSAAGLRSLRHRLRGC